MAGYIKSHSNYRLQSRHQVVNKGTIFERDISTVGGVNSFATGQATIYQSGNFVMVVNNSSSAPRHIKKKGWLASGNDDNTWNKGILAQHSSDITGSIEREIMLKNDFMDLRSFAYYGSLADLVENTVRSIVMTFPYEIYVGDTSETIESSGKTLYRASNPGGIDIYSTNPSGTTGNVLNNTLGHFYDDGYKNYRVIVGNEECEIVGWTVSDLSDVCLEPGAYIATITITYKNDEDTEPVITLYAYVNNERGIDYYVEDSVAQEGYHIRPRSDMSFYDDFVDNLDLFGKCLIGVYSGIRNTAKFEVLTESDKGIKRIIEIFVFPYGPGGYNLGSADNATQSYIQKLGAIGLKYDEIYTDNLFRMMTHDSLKNLDWTSNFNGNEGDEDNEYVQNGKKFSAIMRVMGYVFDQEKAYIDAMSNVNTITYSNRGNLSDYFLTDALETDGFCVNTIYPYMLSEYNNEGKVVHDWDEEKQKNNIYKRRFSENTSEIITPYEYSDGAFYTKCISGETQDIEIENYSGGTYYVEPESNIVYNVLKNYHDDTEMTVPEVNNEFMKRMKINSRALLRKKGTIDGIEAMLSLFGFKSKRWYDKCKEKKGKFYDYDIQEMTYLTRPVWDGWDKVHSMNTIDWYNSCKTIPYNTEAYINGEYVPYQGLPVAYRLDERYSYDPNVNYEQFVSARTEVESDEWAQVVVDSGDKILFGIRHDGTAYTPDLGSGATISGTSITAIIGGLIRPRKLYPSFMPNGDYDGGMYYQMHGGWIGYTPYSFDKNDKIFEVNEDFKRLARVETKRNIVQARNIDELLNQPTGDLYDGIVYYVLDTRDKYAIIDGQTYKLTTEIVNDEEKYYFEVEIYGSSLSVGGILYEGVVEVSNGEGSSGTTSINLGIYADGTPVRIYYTGNREEAFIIKSGADLTPFNTQIFINGSYTSDENESHYFVLQDTLHPDFLGDNYWRQIPVDSWEYKMYENVLDNTNGNNPHSGNFIYDSGYEYLYRHEKLFAYALVNGLFNESCFLDVDSAYKEMEGYGFPLSGHTDEKVHAFVDLKDVSGNTTSYDMNSKDSLSGYSEYVTDDNDGVTSQIINVKNFTLTFYLKQDSLYSKEGQEELKYIQDKVMPYLEQMLPSGAIMDVRFGAQPVDLGLPSGTLWAKTNLGATKETDYGFYFQWGDTQGYSGITTNKQFVWDDYKWYDSTSETLTKYNSEDGLTVLENSNDAIWTATNGVYRMPTEEQIRELYHDTTHEWTNIDGVNGMKFISNKDRTKYIFIPAGGDCGDGELGDEGNYGFIWSTAINLNNNNEACDLTVNNNSVRVFNDARYYGHNLRGVLS